MRKYSRNFKNVFKPIGYHLVTFSLIYQKMIHILQFHSYYVINRQIFWIFCAFLFYINGIIIKMWIYLFTYFICETKLSNFVHFAQLQLQQIFFFFFLGRIKIFPILSLGQNSFNIPVLQRLLDIIVQRCKTNILSDLSFNYFYVIMSERWLEMSF